MSFAWWFFVHFKLESDQVQGKILFEKFKAEIHAECVLWSKIFSKLFIAELFTT